MLYNNPYPQIPAGVIALGTFDGVHIGHAAVIKTAATLAREMHAPCTVWCFSAPPRAVFDASVFPLVTPEEKAFLLTSLGTDNIVMPRPSRELLATEPEEFLDRLTEACSPRRVVVGFNFTYGKGGKGAVPDLADHLARHGIPVTVVPPVMLDGRPVSSTEIRAALSRGDEERVRRLLGR